MSISSKPFEPESIYLPILPGPGDLHVRVAGRARGKPLLLFHGSGADVTWRTWEPQMDAFGEVRRIYALDWPGWGDSAGVRPEGAERFNPAPMVELALRVMDTLDIARADVGGVSWGGLISLELGAGRARACQQAAVGRRRLPAGGFGGGTLRGGDAAGLSGLGGRGSDHPTLAWEGVGCRPAKLQPAHVPGSDALAAPSARGCFQRDGGGVFAGNLKLTRS